MVDTLTPFQRSQRMSRVRDKNTKPEKIVRSLLHRMGFRFRLHCQSLPGKPDVVLARHKKVIFIHGCFWHRHGVCRELSIPENNPEFWAKKFAGNVERDVKKIAAIRARGWRALVVWECELKNMAKLEKTLRRFLNSNQNA